MSLSVFLCLYVIRDVACISRKPHCRTLPFFVHVDCGRGSVFYILAALRGLLNVTYFRFFLMTSHNGLYARHVYAYNSTTVPLRPKITID